MSKLQEQLDKLKGKELKSFQDLLDLSPEYLTKLKGDQGERGESGTDGSDGKDGLHGIDGKDGMDGVNGKDGSNGKDGIDGINGKDGVNGKDGKDGSPDTPEQVRDKIESLKGDERVDKGAIKGLEKIIDKDTLDRAIAILDNRTSFLINRINSLPQQQGTGAVGSVDGFTGEIKLKRVVEIAVTDPNGDVLTTGDGKAFHRINEVLDGYNLVAVAAQVSTVSSSGNPTVQVRNVTQGADMLTTLLTIDATEFDSEDATQAVIDTANDDVAAGDQIRIDVDVAGTGTKGLLVQLTFQMP